MSSLELGRVLARLGVAAALTVGLTACLQPLYGPTASGASLPALLAAIEVAPVVVPPDHQRMSHFLRSELVYELDGSGQPAPKRYILAVTVTPRLQTPIIEAGTGRATAATLAADAAYTVTTLDGKPVTNGKVIGSATYERSPQRFAIVRAARDAEIRLSRVLAEQIRARLALSLRGAA